MVLYLYSLFLTFIRCSADAWRMSRPLMSMPIFHVSLKWSNKCQCLPGSAFCWCWRDVFLFADVEPHPPSHYAWYIPGTQVDAFGTRINIITTIITDKMLRFCSIVQLQFPATVILYSWFCWPAAYYAALTLPPHKTTIERTCDHMCWPGSNGYIKWKHRTFPL